MLVQFSRRSIKALLLFANASSGVDAGGHILPGEVAQAVAEQKKNAVSWLQRAEKGAAGPAAVPVAAAGSATAAALLQDEPAPPPPPYSGMTLGALTAEVARLKSSIDAQVQAVVDDVMQPGICETLISSLGHERMCTGQPGNAS
eukprot:SAG22_NODE_7116_length_774_cov_1.005926_1_plen_144_part_01